MFLGLLYRVNGGPPAVVDLGSAGTLAVCKAEHLGGFEFKPPGSDVEAKLPTALTGGGTTTSRQPKGRKGQWPFI